MDKIILPYRGKTPVIDPSAFIAPSAAVIGDVTVGAGSSIWQPCSDRARAARR